MKRDKEMVDEMNEKDEKIEAFEELRAVQNYMIDFRPLLLTQKIEKIQENLNKPDYPSHDFDELTEKSSE